jgi:hypothetical protein
VKRDSSSSNQPRDLWFRVNPYKYPILIAHLELEHLFLMGLVKRDSPTTNQPRDFNPPGA